MNTIMLHIKRTLLVFVPIVLIFSACESTTVSDSETQELFFKLYGSFYKESFSDIALSSNGNVKVIGTSGTSNDGEDLFYLEIDSYGQIVTENTNKHDTIYFTEGHDIFIASATQEYIAYSHRVAEDSCSINFVNTASSAIDSTVISSNVYTSRLKSVKMYSVDSDGIQYIVNMTDSSGSDVICLYKTYFSGNTELQLKHTLAYSVQEGNKIYSAYNPDGTIVIAVPVEVNSGKNNILVIAIKNNSVLWSFNYGEENVDEQNAEIYIVNDKIYLSTTIEINDKNSNIGMLTLSLINGDQLSFNKFTVEEVKDDETNRLSLTSALINETGNFILVGNHSTGVSTTKMFIKEVTPELTVVSESTFGHNQNSNGGKIIYSQAEDCYYFSGVLNSNKSEDISVFKLNKEWKWIE